MMSLSQIKLALGGLIVTAVSFHVQAEEDVSLISLQKNKTIYTINRDGSYREEHEVLKRIEKEDGISSEGEEQLFYSPKLESIKILEAYTLTPGGARIKVPSKSIHMAKGEVGGGGYKDTNSIAIIYPKVAVGSQLYMRYVKTCHTPLFKGHFAVRRAVSPHVKASNFEVEINFDRHLDLQIGSQGVEGGALPDKNGLHRYHFSYNKQDEVIPYENGQIDSGDVSPYVEASTFADYAALGAVYQEKMKNKVNVTPEIKKLAKELTQGVDQPKEQIRQLYNWVSKHIRYVSSYIGNGGFVPHDSKTILSNRWGDCKDHVVILEALLAAKGIESSAALINTSATFKLPKLAGIYAFNHAITYVPSLNLYLDSTSQFSPMGSLPSVDLDKYVVLTSLGKVGKTPPMLASENTSRSTVRMKVLPDGTIQGTSKIIDTGTNDISLRYTKFISQSLTQEQLADILLDTTNLTGKGKIHSTDPNNLNQPLEVNSTFTLDPVSNIPGPGSMMIPAGLVDDVISRSTFPKPKDKIKLPVVCHSSTASNDYEIEFPSNIRITHIPENVHYVDPIVEYTARYELMGNVLNVHRELVNQNKTMVCGKEENALDKKFFPVFQRDMRAQIIYE